MQHIKMENFAGKKKSNLIKYFHVQWPHQIYCFCSYVGASTGKVHLWEEKGYKKLYWKCLIFWLMFFWGSRAFNLEKKAPSYTVNCSFRHHLQKMIKAFWILLKNKLGFLFCVFKISAFAYVLNIIPAWMEKLVSTMAQLIKSYSYRRIFVVKSSNTNVY